MQQDNDNPVISRQVIEMITVAHEYCVYFEQVEKFQTREILSFFQKIGPLLYLKGAMLPADIEADPEFAERHVTEEQWEIVFKSLREKFAEKDLYHTLDENADSRQNSLADNMADVYQDMKDFVLLYQKAPIQSKACAVAELQKLFENHWGKIILKALDAIHNILYIPGVSPDLIDDWEE